MQKHHYLNFILLFIAVILTGCLARPERPGIANRPPAPVLNIKPKTAEQLKEKYADIVGVSPYEINNVALYNFIEEWIGIPHRLGGQDKRGIDCSFFTYQLVRDIYRKDLPRTANDMAQVVKRKYENQLQEGDLVFFNFSGSGNFDHVGIYLANDRFVHVSTSKGVMISNLKEPWFRKYFTRAGSI